jgi:hypothetical protein
LCCSCLHAAGTGNDLWANFGHNGNVRGTAEWGIAVTGHGNGFGATTPSVFDCGNGERGAPAGRDSDHHVVLAGSFLCNFASAELARVFADLDGAEQSLCASGNHELHGFRVGAESGRAFGGIEGGDAPAGSCAYVDEPSALFEGRCDQIDGFGDLRQSALHGRGNFGVFFIYYADDFEGGFGVEVLRSGIGLLSAQRAQLLRFSCPLHLISNASTTAS